ncbi:uncharacterized protein V6R79_023713 [Siganus canaliculatus]
MSAPLPRPSSQAATPGVFYLRGFALGDESAAENCNKLCGKSVFIQCFFPASDVETLYYKRKCSVCVTVPRIVFKAQRKSFHNDTCQMLPLLPLCIQAVCCGKASTTGTQQILCLTPCMLLLACGYTSQKHTEHRRMLKEPGNMTPAATALTSGEASECGHGPTTILQGQQQ